jgi:3-phosphoshikimate 1-carboxyvinyltransferase
MEIRVKPAATFCGELVPPGDKSISHRAAILNALASGRAVIENFSPGEDCRATLACLRALGVEVKYHDSGRVEVYGDGKLKEAEDVLDAGNSGTTIRLLCGVLAAQPFLSIITGDASLRSRPMDRGPRE